MSDTSVLRRHRIAVSSDGENVTLTIGNAAVSFHYEDALKLSQWMRLRAKEAKRRCGDHSRAWSAIAFLEDAEEAYRLGLK